MFRDYDCSKQQSNVKSVLDSTKASITMNDSKYKESTENI